MCRDVRAHLQGGLATSWVLGTLYALSPSLKSSSLNPHLNGWGGGGEAEAGAQKESHFVRKQEA